MKYLLLCLCLVGCADKRQIKMETLNKSLELCKRMCMACEERFDHMTVDSDGYLEQCHCDEEKK